MSRSPDILFMTEYIKNVLYFATIRPGKILKHTDDTHYFSIDDDLTYENYYADFGPLNLGCVYKYCKILNEKLKIYINKQYIVHYTSVDPKKKANSAFLMGCYGVLYLSLPPKDALKPLLVHGQSYRPFQDATQGDSNYTISLMDCLQGFCKARDLSFFNFQDFNYVEYDRLDKIQGGDLNWIVPAFIGPVDYCVSLYHPPEMYIDYFIENNVKIVIRLNKKLYDGNVFVNAGITHYNLFFPDGSCPPRHILFKFLQISEECDGAIAVHCKAGLGRTGSLIGCYLIKHYRMSAHEAIAWMRICRPGSVIAQQQGWMEELEPWLIKQGNLYRKRNYHDSDKLPTHEFGVYSIAEKTHKKIPAMLSKSQSPPPPIQRQVRPDSPVARPQASKARDESSKNDEEVFITACDLTVKPSEPMDKMKGCAMRNTIIAEEYSSRENEINIPLWKKYLCCKPCVKTCCDKLWILAVRCTKIAPNECYSNKCCILLDWVAPRKTTEKPQLGWKERLSAGSKLKGTEQTENPQFSWKERLSAGSKLPIKGTELSEKPQFKWKERLSVGSKLPIKEAELTEKPQFGWKEHINSGQKNLMKGKPRDTNGPVRCGAGEPRLLRPSSRPNSVKQQDHDRNISGCFHVPTFQTSQTPIARTLDDARNILMRSTLYTDQRTNIYNQRTALSNEQRARKLDSAIFVKPQYSIRGTSNAFNERPVPGNVTKLVPATFSTVPKSQTQPQQRRRLGRSPSPTVTKMATEQSRATNTPPPTVYRNYHSKTNLKEELSRLKLTAPRHGSIGAASLGARRDAPTDRRAPSVRSDERPLATQGDMLNSIKFQRRFRETLNAEKSGNLNNMPSTASKDKPTIRNISSRTNSAGPKPHVSPETRFNYPSEEKTSPNMTRRFFRAPRPSSPKGKRSAHPFF